MHVSYAAVCFPPVGCLNGGICVLPSLCVCVSDWSGRQCEIREF